MKGTLLEVRDVFVGYGRVQILHGVSIRLEHEGRVGLFGPNGHGKSTLLATISGLLRPWQGQIIFRGEVLNGLSSHEIVERGIIQVPQGNLLFPRMTVRENLLMGAYPRRTWNSRLSRMERVFDLFPRLADRMNQFCRTLSGGERQMLAIGVGLMADPAVLIVDEPTLGLAPKVKDEVREAIEKVAFGGVPLIIVEQDIEFLLSLAQRLYLIEEGRVVLETDSSEGFLDQSTVMQMYFGRNRQG